MSYVRLSRNVEAGASCRGGAVAIGNFDGVHRGHGALLEMLCQKARALGGPAVVLTFDPHPLQLLRPDLFQPVLTSPAARAVLLQECGADHVVILATTREFLQLTPKAFFDEVLRQQLSAKALVEGKDFRFGRDRAGTIDTLAELCQSSGLELTVIPPIALDGQIVSSSKVRAALLNGDLSLAERYLGRRYRIEGRVGDGQRRGRTIGFPTANLDGIATLLPADGVYAVRVFGLERTWPGAANIGSNPTFNEQTRKVEVHLIGYQGDLYGKTLTVEFVKRLRETKPFANVTELSEQLRRDVEEARRAAGEGGDSQ